MHRSDKIFALTTVDVRQSALARTLIQLRQTGFLEKLGEYRKGEGSVLVVCRCLVGCFLDVAEFHAVLGYVAGSFDVCCGLFV